MQITMKRLGLIFGFSFFSFWNCYSQFGIINDSDGYTNIRKESNINSEIKWKLYDNELFFFDEEYVANNDWKYIYFFKPVDSLKKMNPNFEIENQPFEDNRISSSGFIHSSRVQPLKDISVKVETKLNENSSSFRNESIELLIERKVFDTTEHKIGRDKDGWVSTIDNKYPYGIDGDLPHNEISNIQLKITGQNITIPKESYSDLFEPNFKTTEIFHKENAWFIIMSNSDAAGYYYVAWIIQDNKFWQRYIFRPY